MHSASVAALQRSAGTALRACACVSSMRRIASGSARYGFSASPGSRQLAARTQTATPSPPAAAVKSSFAWPLPPAPRRPASSDASAFGVGASNTNMWGRLPTSSVAPSALTKAKTIMDVKPLCMKGASSGTASGTPTEISASAIAASARALASFASPGGGGGGASDGVAAAAGFADPSSSSKDRQTPLSTTGFCVASVTSPHLMRFVLPVAVLGTSSLRMA